MSHFDPDDALVPVFLKTKAPNRTAQMGTAVFAELHGEPFLYTAPHVTDELLSGELLVPTKNGLCPIEGYIAYIDLPPEFPRSDDNTDIAYCRLSSEFAWELCYHFRPIPQNRCEIVPNAMALSVCSVSGYPASKAKMAKDRTRSSEAFTFRGVVADADTYAKYSLSPEQSIVINFSKSPSGKFMKEDNIG